MNYALDALWWKLEQQNVRDLASLLTAPSLWNTGCELSVATLLGDTGFRFLLALDKNPQPLLEHLRGVFPYQYRLGFYAESLLTFWLTHSPHWQLLARNVVVSEKSRTIGALEFIAQTRNTDTPHLYHIELTCKYYFSQYEPATETSFIGLNPTDHLNKKTNKLVQQLALIQHPDLQALIKQNNWQNITSSSIVRGITFTPSGTLPKNTILNPYAWAGCVYTSKTLPVQWQESRFWLFRSLKLLAPVRAEINHTVAVETLLSTDTPRICAVLSQRPDGFYHEENRFILLPD